MRGPIPRTPHVGAPRWFDVVSTVVLSIMAAVGLVIAVRNAQWPGAVIMMIALILSLYVLFAWVIEQ